MRDSTIFYRSFFEAIKELPTENQAELYNAIFEYALNFELIELIGISKTVFTLIKPQIDANIKRFNNGSKPKNKGEKSETEASEEQNESKSETNNNDNVNVNLNSNKNKKKKIFTPPTIEEVKKFFNENGYKEETAIKAFNHYALNDWKNSKDKPVSNWKRTMSNNWFKEEGKLPVLSQIPTIKHTGTTAFQI